LASDDDKSKGLESEECREKLVDYLFSNQDNTKLFLESNNLNDFLGALDSLFQTNNEINNKSKNNNDINSLCDQILNIYNEIFIEIQQNKTTTNKLDGENKNNDKNTKLTTFPNYANPDVAVAVVDSTTTTTISMCDSDVGPFLCAILNRLEHMLSNSLQVNFLITGLLARLAYYPHFVLRSFLLNHSLVNTKSLFQAITNVKFKIDNCSKTYENFSLLYLKAKLFLVKRLIDSKSSESDTTNSSRMNSTQLAANESASSNLTPPSGKKKFSKMDKFLSIFFKPLIELTPQNEGDDDEDANISGMPYTPKSQFSYDDENVSPQAEMQLDDVKMKFSKPVESIQLKQFSNEVNDFSMIENEWEDFNTRNIAFSAVVYDEFIKELAAICQEHCVTTQNAF
jgi:hypothetical protein